MTIYISNAFSLSMINRSLQDAATYDCVTEDARVPRPVFDPVAWLAYQKGQPVASAIGHADTAAIFSQLLLLKLEPRRVSIKLAPGDKLLVGQYIGPRLPEGATTLPEGAVIEWWEV